MQAISVTQFGGPEVLHMTDVPEPRPQAGQILVRITAAGVNPVETYIRAGIYGPMPFPYTPGNDGGGVVEALGANVTGFEIGNRVYTDKSISGTYAPLAVCNPVNVHRLPEAISFEQGACVGIAAGTAWRALFQRGGAVAGETILIHGGTGGVGTSAIQLARAAGMTVIATASALEGRRYVSDHGAHHAVGHDVTKNEELWKSLTGGRGFDLIVELLANMNLASDLSALAKNGRVVVVGSRGKIEIDPRETMKREADIRGLMLGGATEKEHREIYSGLTAAMESGVLKPVVGMQLPLAEAAKAHREVIDGHVFGKIVLLP
jgi:NADPH2:quinone reductase